MTGQNKYVLSVFAKMYRLDKRNLETILRNCKDVLTKQDILQLSNIGIPAYPLNMKTKEQVLKYILNEVKDLIPTFRKSSLRQVDKLLFHIGNRVNKLVKS